MQILFTVSLPFFALIFCGYAAGRFRALSDASVVGLNAFAFYFALPTLLFMKMSEARVVELFDWRLIAAYSGGGLIAYAVCATAGRLLFTRRLSENALQGLAAAFPNIGYLGLPLVIAVFGDQAALPGVLVLVFDHLLLLPLTTALIEAGEGKDRGIGTIVFSVVAGLARNPLIIATVAGVLWGLNDVPLPVPLQAFGALLGSAAAPCALFALGANLVGRPISDNVREVALLTICKLAVHPAATAVIGYHVLALDPWLADVAVIEAALPVAANVFVMAGAYGIYVARTSTAILVSTTISVVTVSVLLAVLAPDEGTLPIEPPPAAAAG